MTEMRDAYPHLSAITTRWADNDALGHINNVQYYAFFDTAVTRWPAQRGFLHPSQGETVCFVVETGCGYFGHWPSPSPSPWGCG